MADGLTITGRDALLRGVDALPRAVTAELRTVAKRSAESIRNDARRRLIAQQKSASRKLADAIDVVEEDRQFIARSRPPSGQPANITIWNEHGTSRMGARPYMRPAADAEGPIYVRQAEAIVTRLARTVFGS